MKYDNEEARFNYKLTWYTEIEDPIFEDETAVILVTHEQVVLVSLHNHLQVHRFAKSALNLLVGELLELRSERGNRGIAHCIGCYEVQHSLEYQRTPPTEVHHLRSVRLYGRILVSGATPYFNGVVVEEIELSGIARNVN